MLVVAAGLFYGTGRTGVDSIEGAHAGFETLLGGGAALAFAIALLSSGRSSSSVGPTPDRSPCTHHRPQRLPPLRDFFG